MSNKALVKRSKGSGVVPAVASGLLPGLGQLINRQGDKGIGVFVVWGGAAVVAWTGLPLLAGVAGAVAGGTWIYGVVDGYLTGKKRGAR